MAVGVYVHCYVYPNSASMEKLPLKIEGEGVWDPIFSLVKIANLPELLMWSLDLVTALLMAILGGVFWVEVRFKD